MPKNSKGQGIIIIIFFLLFAARCGILNEKHIISRLDSG